MEIAIASGKGGTGKTTLATNLASLLAEQRKVVLADLDVEEPNSGLFIRGELRETKTAYKKVPHWVEDACTNCGLCQKVCNFNAVLSLKDEVMLFPKLCHGCFACSELCPVGALPMVDERMGEIKRIDLKTLSFVEGSLDVGQEQAVPLIEQTKDYVRENFHTDYIRIFDSPPGTSCPVIEAVKDADIIILVTEPTPFGLHDLTLAVETVRKMEKEFGVVINRFGIGNDDVLGYCKKEGVDILAKLPNLRKAAELYSRGDLLFSSLPEFRKELDSLLEKLGVYGSLGAGR